MYPHSFCFHFKTKRGGSEITIQLCKATKDGEFEYHYKSNLAVMMAEINSWASNLTPPYCVTISENDPYVPWYMSSCCFSQTSKWEQSCLGVCWRIKIICATEDNGYAVPVAPPLELLILQHNHCLYSTAHTQYVQQQFNILPVSRLHTVTILNHSTYDKQQHACMYDLSGNSQVIKILLGMFPDTKSKFRGERGFLSF